MIRYSLLSLLLFFAHLSNAQLTLPLAKNLLIDAQQAQKQRVPILIMFSIPDCIYCEKIKEDVLIPMAQTQKHKKRLIIRHIDATNNALVTNFHNEIVSHRDFSLQYGIDFFPTILLLDNYGTILSKIIGVPNEEFYWTHLDKTITQANNKLQQKLNKL